MSVLYVHIVSPKTCTSLWGIIYSPRSSRLLASLNNIMSYEMMPPDINQRVGALCLVLRLSSGGGNA